MLLFNTLQNKETNNKSNKNIWKTSTVGLQ